MKRILFTLSILAAFCSVASAQSGYGGDGKTSGDSSVAIYMRLYETPPTAATTALAGAGAGNVDNGAHLVKVTCYASSGQTSGGTASNSTTVADKTSNGKIAISAIPTCSGLATGRKVYMTTAGGSTYYLLSNGTIANNTATTLTANDADATLTASTVLPTSNTMLDARQTVGQNLVSFPVSIGVTTTGSAAVPALGITLTNGVAADSGFYVATNNYTNLGISVAGTVSGVTFSASNRGMMLGSGARVTWALDGNPASAQDSGAYRVAAGVVGASLGTTGAGWFQNSGGEGALTAAFTNATTTFASSNLSYTVVAGRSYRIHGILAIANSTAGHGVKLDFNGGSATATTFFATATVKGGGTATAGTLISTSLAGVLNYTSVTSTVYVEIDGYLLVNGAGTFILRAAEDSTGGASASLGVGSWIALSDTVVK